MIPDYDHAATSAAEILIRYGIFGTFMDGYTEEDLTIRKSSDFD